MIDFKFMEALVAVIEQGGFEKAAKVLHITQSAISQRIKHLEETAGQILLVRSAPPVPTDAGIHIIKYFKQVKQLEEELLENLLPAQKSTFKPLAVGINADALATWFLDAVIPFLKKERVTLDIRVDDQDETHAMLRDGEVFGCISSKEISIQGCSSRFLGEMTYRMVATPNFVNQWFSNADAKEKYPIGNNHSKSVKKNRQINFVPRLNTISRESIQKAPMLVFNMKDELQHRALRAALNGNLPDGIPTHYLPSSEKFLTFILSDMAYGMLPDIQSRPYLERGDLVELFPDHPICVPLFWHCWNIKFQLLENFSRTLIDKAAILLESS